MKTNRFFYITACLLTVLGLMLRGAAALPEPRGQEPVQVPIIMYHSINKRADNVWTITPEAFATDMRYLHENGYHTVTITDLVNFVDGGGPLPDKPVVLTFDDGSYNNLVYAMPLLEKYDMEMVLSVIGSASQKWSEHDDERNERGGHLTWDMLGDMLDTGRVELSNHTWDLHNNQKGRNGICRKKGEDVDKYRQVIIADIGKLQEKITSTYGITPICFAYPFGSKCKESTDILKSMGFRATLSCREGNNCIISGSPDCLFDLKRNNRTPGKPISAILKKLEAA